eukprot:COSAG04_NODE_20_length_39202_cov_9.993530_4_plen_80_part_00
MTVLCGGSGFLAPGSVGQPAQDYWLMVYDYMSEGNGPVPLELKVCTQHKPPAQANNNPHAQKPQLSALPRNHGSPREPN